MDLPIISPKVQDLTVPHNSTGQQHDTTQDAVTAPIITVARDTSSDSESDSKGECLNVQDSTGVRCKIKVSDKTATVKPSPR